MTYNNFVVDFVRLQHAVCENRPVKRSNPYDVRRVMAINANS